MERETMHQSVEVIHRRLSESPKDKLNFAFFQMAYVISGEGKLSINGNRIPYRKGNLMLLTPDDRHNFEVDTESELLLIRFYPSHVKEYRWRSIDHIECLLYHASHLSGCILRNELDYPLVEGLVASLLHGIKHGGAYQEDLTMHFVDALIVIAARNIASMRPRAVAANADRRISEIIDYIQANIFSPGDLRAPVIAARFGISGSYLGSYFKQHCGETIQHFITGYKLRLIEHRLKFSDQRINEIAHEFGFSDESHLNKFFKKHRQGVSLTKFRQAN
jgi:AraC-like DNA-binding protein